LYADRRVQRSELQPRRLARHGHTRRQMQRQWLAATGALPSPQMLWSRNSVFHRCGAQLRVMEVFVPELARRDPQRRGRR
jgi:chorismate--pyruvate lyase